MIRNTVRRIYHHSGARRVHLAAYRASLRARSGVIRNGVGALLHADPADERAALLAMRKGALDRDAVRIWQGLAAEIRPTVAVDVGANYGEVAFSARYDGLRELHLVEPNPEVLRWLSRTVSAMSGVVPGIVLHAGAASDVSGTARLNFHGHSGGSSLAVPSSYGIDVPCFRLDERIHLRPHEPLLFKVDVEGHERLAMEGMSGLLEGRTVGGICEVLHADHLLPEYLCDRFAVSIVRRGREVPVDAGELRVAIDEARASDWNSGLSKDVVLRSH